MAVTYEDYINVLKNSNNRKPIFKISLLRDDETERENITDYILNSGGILNISRNNGVRRNFQIELSNKYKNFFPNQDTLPIRQKIALWAGLEINGEEYLKKQGVFVLRNPVYNISGSNNTFTLNAVDKFALANGTLGGETDGIYSIPAGTEIPEAVRMVLVPSDDSKKEIFYDTTPPVIDVAFNSETTPYTIEIGSGEPVSKILVQLADMVSANVFYDTNGRLVFQKDVSDNIKFSQYDFEAGDYNWVETTKTYDNEKVYNAVRVIGTNVNGVNFSYTEYNYNPLSDSAIQNVGYKRVYEITDSNITTLQRAEDRAKYELKKLINAQTRQTFTCLPMYHILSDEVITITDEGQDSERVRNVVESMSIPLSVSGLMSVTVSESADLIDI